MRVISAVLAWLMLSLPSGADGQALPSQDPQVLELDTQPLDQALSVLSETFDLNILSSSETLKARSGRLERGSYTLEEALALLLEPHGLAYEFTESSTLYIHSVANNDNAQQPSPPQTSQTETRPDTIIVTGSRIRGSAQAMKLAPVNIFTAQALETNASDELIDGLAQLLPSFTTFRFPLNDGLIYNRPTGLRGLNPDHTLILVNGKRRHRSAFLESTRGQAVDLTHIPISAIKRIEVLKDGASAQYGSDAIAGVINVILDDAPDPILMGQWGQYYQGDGTQYRLAAQAGWSNTAQTFAVLNVEAFTTEPTSRSRQRQDALVFAQSHPDLTLPSPVQNWGQPHREGLRVLANFQSGLPYDLEIYGFGHGSYTQGVSDFNWRNPDTTSAYAANPAFPDFDLRDTYPIGFTPQFGQDEYDYSLALGVRHSLASHWSWDLALTRGHNQIEYRIRETVNPSLGPLSPTAFKPGELRQTEQGLTFDLQSPFYGPQSIQLALGAEIREERYHVRAGDEASYQTGPGALYGAPVGSNGFPGYTPDQAGDFYQTSAATYIEIQNAASHRFRWGLAGRFEHFSLFGETVNGKVSAAYDLTPALFIRSTLSTGFRAPTPGQVFSERSSQGLVSQTLNIRERGRFSPEGRLAALLSERPKTKIEALRPETAQNFTIGVGYTSDQGLSLSADYYIIEVTDRFRLSEIYTLSEAEQNQLRQEGQLRLAQTDQITFFQNDYDTRTSGVDIALEYDRDLWSGHVKVSGVYNYLKTDVTSGRFINDPTLETLIENEFPKQRLTLTALYQSEAWGLFLRTRTYGEWWDRAGVDQVEPFQVFSPKTFVDLGFDFKLRPQTQLRLGAENIFNTYPDEATRNANRGLIYSRSAPHDTDGGQYYLRLTTRY